MSNSRKYKTVSTYRELERVVKRCKKLGHTALDFETTSLYPAEGRVRLVSLCNTKVSVLVDFDKIRGGFKKCAHLFEGGTWIVYFAGFEYSWFAHNGSPSVECWDVGNLRRAMLGGGIYKLAQVLKWDLDYDMPKDEQNSNWNAPVLTKEQLDYAYDDAHWTWKLWRFWADQADEGHWGGFHMLNDMVPGVYEMQHAGMMLDIPTHQKLINKWEAARDHRVEKLREMVNNNEVANINSDVQWSDYFARHLPDQFLNAWPRTEKTGQLSMKTKTLQDLAAQVIGTPLETFFDALGEYKTISKYLSSFGDTLITKAQLSGDSSLHAQYNIGAAKTCRFSSSDPNVQQMPRDRDLLGEHTSVRTSFKARLGRKLVSYDYTGIELRVLALISGDKQLLADMLAGDVHAEVGSYMVGKKVSKKTKWGKLARQAAKPVSFLIVYGGSASGLNSATRCGFDKAQDLIDFWSSRYPDAFRYRFDAKDEADATRYIRMVDGGTVYMGKKPELPKCANYGVQRAAMAVMSRAIVRHKITLDKERAAGRQRMTQMLATIHDALIDEAATKDAKRCAKLMDADMTAAFLDVFPGADTARLLEGGVGPTWGELEDV